jgi:hypothetical protein
MAITNSFAKFIFHVKKNGANFNNILTLGRLRLYTQALVLNQYAKAAGIDLDFAGTEGQDYSEGFFKILGAGKVDSMDYSDYEKAEIIHDLNVAIPQAMHQKYNVVLDSGTLEHVFNFPVAIKSCMDALEVGGTYIGVTPANNMMGHGFYQFSPELFYRIFSAENGFEVKCMFIGVENDGGEVEKWYDVKDPAEVRARVTLRNFKETYLFIAAEKKKQVSVLTTNPFQSDYVSAWKNAEDNYNTNMSGAKKLYKQAVPESGQKIIRKVKNYFIKSRKYADDSVGFINPSHFTEIKL